MVTTLGAIVLVAAVVFFILQPVLVGLRAPLGREEDELTESESRRRVSLKALRDVEYDYATGKLDDADYRDLRGEISAEALAALEAEEAEALAVTTGEGSDLEARVASVRAGLRSGATCRGCGHLNPSASRFCGSCGAPLAGGPSAARGG